MFNQKKFIAFSLIELLAVLTILGILLALGVPSYKQYIAKAKMTELFALVDLHKLKVMEKIIYHSTSNKPEDNYLLENPNQVVTKLEHLINYPQKKYIIKITANMAYLGVETVEDQALLIEFIANLPEDSTELITWQCQYNKGYSNLMPKVCKEMA